MSESALPRFATDVLFGRTLFRSSYEIVRAFRKRFELLSVIRLGLPRPRPRRTPLPLKLVRVLLRHLQGRPGLGTVDALHLLRPLLRHSRSALGPVDLLLQPPDDGGRLHQRSGGAAQLLVAHVQRRLQRVLHSEQILHGRLVLLCLHLRLTLAPPGLLEHLREPDALLVGLVQLRGHTVEVAQVRLCFRHFLLVLKQRLDLNRRLVLNFPELLHLVLDQLQLVVVRRERVYSIPVCHLCVVHHGRIHLENLIFLLISRDVR
mmetsp:Transcript_1849/g.3181  ORF Transcript_1849/g.3181 Transcript_1849/m.3181 type:complete len:262 (+) Transcript_1849:470-1255(+)